MGLLDTDKKYRMKEEVFGIPIRIQTENGFAWGTKVHAEDPLHFGDIITLQKSNGTCGFVIIKAIYSTEVGSNNSIYHTEIAPNDILWATIKNSRQIDEDRVSMSYGATTTTKEPKMNSNKIQTEANRALTQNKDAAVLAAKLELGRAANKQLMKALKKQLPKAVKPHLDNPLGQLMVANLAAVLLSQFASGPKATAISDALVQSAAVEAMRVLDVAGLVADFVDGVKVPYIVLGDE